MRSRLFIAALALVALAGCKGAGETATPPADSTKQIDQLFANWKKAAEAKDLDGVMAMYAPGNALTAYDVVAPLQFKGIDAYRKDYADFFGQFDGPIHIDLGESHVETGSDVAFAYGLERLTGKMKDGTPVDIWLRYTEGLKLIDGKWRVVHEHISVPVDLNTGKARLDLKP